MSRWTQIRGAFSIECGAHEEIKGKKILPFPNEQLTLHVPKVQGGNLHIGATIHSFPRARKYIEYALNKFMPQGECGLNYFLNTNKKQARMSCSAFGNKCDEKIYKEAIEKMYKDDNWSYKDLKKYQGLEHGFIDYNTETYVTICDAIRYASGKEVLIGLEKVFNYLLVEKGFELGFNGILEWEDEYINDKVFMWKITNSLNYSFLIIDNKKVIAHKDYIYDLDKDSYVVQETDSWQEVMSMLFPE